MTGSVHVDALLGGYGFDLDPFQSRATEAIDAGRSVLVAAPTGSGKTVVAEYAIAEALDRGLRAFYTTPIKALSNQKFSDLRDQHGAGRVGLLTGDNAIEPDAPVVVMTTEVLRNMIYAGRNLDDLAVVVLDEVHYLQDTFRGPVWEEVIVHLPEHVQLVCLSATVSNAHDIGDWLTTVRGPTDVVVEHRRPVELADTYLVGDRSSDRMHLIDTLVDGRPNHEGYRFDAEDTRVRGQRRSGRGRAERRSWFTPDRLDVLDVLVDRSLLPAIVFIFSRAACDDAVAQLLAANVRLTTATEAAEIRRVVDAHLDALTAADRRALEADRWAAGLEAGFGAHHAGHVPAFKEAVEACFERGLVKVVFATETLALGVNMPARAVVIERLTKFNGEAKVPLTPGEYTQLTGRAGRRGIDTHGTAIVLWSPFVSFGTVAALAASESFALRSAFRPTYNMAANLIRRHDEVEARRLLNLCLAQFQTDRAVVVLERRLDKRRELLGRAQDEATCELGDVAEYVRMVQAPRSRAERRQEVAHALAALKPGDLLDLDDRIVAVLSVAHRKGGAVVLKAVTAQRNLVQLDAGDFPEGPVRLDRVELPVPYRPDDRDFRATVAATVADREARARRVAVPAGPPVDHPVARCPDAGRHVVAWNRARRLEEEVGQLSRRIRRQTSSLGQQFDRVLGVLADFGYVEDWSLTDRGRLLAGVYHEAELIVAEALVEGCFDGLPAAELAAVASVLVHERRAPGPPPPVRYPTRLTRERAMAVDAIVARVQAAEEAAGLPASRSADHGYVRVVHAWCSGVGLGPLLEQDDVETTGGDFVRTARQLIDLVRQIAQLAPARATRTAARAAVRALERGVVAATLGPLDDGDEETW